MGLLDGGRRVFRPLFENLKTWKFLCKAASTTPTVVLTERIMSRQQLLAKIMPEYTAQNEPSLNLRGTKASASARINAEQKKRANLPSDDGHQLA